MNVSKFELRFFAWTLHLKDTLFPLCRFEEQGRRGFVVQTKK